MARAVAHRPIFLSVSKAASDGKVKWKFIVDHAAPPMSAHAQALMIEQVLALMNIVPMYETVDRGHRHTGTQNPRILCIAVMTMVALTAAVMTSTKILIGELDVMALLLLSARVVLATRRERELITALAAPGQWTRSTEPRSSAEPWFPWIQGDGQCSEATLPAADAAIDPVPATPEMAAAVDDAELKALAFSQAASAISHADPMCNPGEASKATVSRAQDLEVEALAACAEAAELLRGERRRAPELGGEIRDKLVQIQSLLDQTRGPTAQAWDRKVKENVSQATVPFEVLSRSIEGFPKKVLKDSCYFVETFGNAILEESWIYAVRGPEATWTPGEPIPDHEVLHSMFLPFVAKIKALGRHWSSDAARPRMSAGEPPWRASSKRTDSDLCASLLSSARVRGCWPADALAFEICCSELARQAINSAVQQAGTQVAQQAARETFQREQATCCANAFEYKRLLCRFARWMYRCFLSRPYGRSPVASMVDASDPCETAPSLEKSSRGCSLCRRSCRREFVLWTPLWS
ncbi:unnamed protein product [Prorocentrum cordatum]|uniref:Uncharacterized protein n=1 Tax=Prorocentrum cordatum TaxID=2364126 RepID=A0ABN9U7Z2_9DINO|nr:unnamed protein product [Polarella glacialis]